MVPRLENQRVKERGQIMRERSRIRIWIILFSVLILHFYIFPHLLPTHDVVGKEGLMRVLVQEIAMLPAMFCLAATIGVEGILWYIHKKQENTGIRKGFVILWVVLLCVNLWWCVTESGKLADAVQDWNCMKEAERKQGKQEPWERDGVDRVVFKNWTVHESSSKRSSRNFYIQNAARTFSFLMGEDRKRKQRIESDRDAELTIYYYHHSHVPLRVCAGNRILAGDGESEMY